jgi:hypothetical protein
LILFRPGQQIKSFEIHRKSSSQSEIGRVTSNSDTQSIGSLYGTITEASQREKDDWKQQNHPITHKVVTQGNTAVKVEDVLVLTDAANTTRKFYVQGKDNPGELGIFQIFYCEERA